jgi:HEAT repeat protein
MWLKPNCQSLLPQNKVSSLPDLLNALISGDETRAEQSVSLLVGLGEEAIPALLDLIRSSDADHRWWGLRVLAQLPSPSGTSRQAGWLVPFLNDPAPEVRQCAALGLAARPDENAIQPLIRALSDKDSMVGNLAANALARIGGAAVDSLIQVVKSAPQTARIQALRALAEIRDHRAIPVMMEVMGEESALLQHWAKEGLERLGLNMVYIKPV